jgi:hypothetical protein
MFTPWTTFDKYFTAACLLVCGILAALCIYAARI